MELKKQGNLIVICGPSAVGKGTICKEFLKTNKDIKLSVSATTRKPREGEINGVNYYFLDKEDFLNKIENDEFLEYATVYDNCYGTPKGPVLENLKQGYDVLLEIDIQGAMQVKEKYPKGVFVFILPPTLKELENRIRNRGTESKEDMEKRLGCAQDEILQVEKYDYFIVNDDLVEATKKLNAIILAEQNSVKKYKKNIIDKFSKEEF
ncbi:MAG: guanylate kinase [Peptostreptococcaceae bacterium]|jgi:guanylate kinase|nr:guanylate kinase [Peptostreptococcaceae bacterium]